MDLIKFILSLQLFDRHITVATNQQCLSKGLIDEVQLRKIHDVIDESLIKIGGKSIQYFVCGHLESDGCTCRKPEPGMLNDIIVKFSVKSKETIFIGDSKTDEEAAISAGINYLYVEELLSWLSPKQI